MSNTLTYQQPGTTARGQTRALFDFQRLRTNTDVITAPFLAASIFLDVLNVFLFFLEIFSGGQGER